MVAGVSPFPNVPKPLQCSPLSPFVKRCLAAPPFSHMTSGLPHLPSMILGIFTAPPFLPWPQGFLTHPSWPHSSSLHPFSHRGLRVPSFTPHSLRAPFFPPLHPFSHHGLKVPSFTPHGLRASQQLQISQSFPAVSHADDSTACTLPRQGPAQSPGLEKESGKRAGCELLMLSDRTGNKCTGLPEEDRLGTPMVLLFLISKKM